ncbi:helix-turn-helix domain-containing protein [Clostridioides difficile]|nr:ATP-binding protein [Clostridioides difficile]EKS6830864.1 ATP-binding protein [Clostridioides difficile]MBY2252347.1 ATP-binding protein [Clostridioides difficile]MCI2384822.1 ATP-binding protein [Clostridioides difficile]MCR1367658.1 ATP-binding protein [Clostridioides difficile]
MNDFKSEISRYLELKQEGAFWDFKRNWYTESKIADLLHDIICMANNLENRDAYIIIGVDEENYELVDVTNDSNRKNTQNIVDFLKDKKFAGEIRPTVLVNQVIIQDVTLDVIVIKNSNKTPFYLKEKYRDVNPNNIYTRIQDTNTPKYMGADIDKVEYLWKKKIWFNSNSN